MQKDQIQVILLAAGNSKRFGSPKLEYKIEQGKTILEQTLSIYLNVFVAKQISVVLQKNSPLIEMVADVNVNVIENPNPDLGMSFSLVMAIHKHINSSAWLVGLADMPYIQAKTLELLVAQAKPANIVVPFYKKQQGNPVVFANEFMTQLIKLKGDVGAKSVILNNQKSIASIDVDDKGVLHDIDRIEDIIPIVF